MEVIKIKEKRIIPIIFFIAIAIILGSLSLYKVNYDAYKNNYNRDFKIYQAMELMEKTSFVNSDDDKGWKAYKTF